ncbi:MAG TPA: hypothetical protein VEL11_00600 [Candidatus Bathyarchaeia archaeon]|nr:hypothetical protein [Candidatus Bathyarchaeia archaeon]
MTSEREQEGNVPNPFLNAIGVWQNYLIYWIEVSRNFYENAIKTNEQWLKAFWDLWLKAGNPERKETAKVE